MHSGRGPVAQLQAHPRFMLNYREQLLVCQEQQASEIAYR
jgi:hypothetical protein